MSRMGCRSCAIRAACWLCISTGALAAERFESFDRDPAWEGRNHRTTAVEKQTIRQDFGYSTTHRARGKAAGELGGLVFRGDCRYADRMAYYADRLKRLSLGGPLRASGLVSLRRGVSDSTTLIGFFHSTRSMKVSDSQKAAIPANFLGVAVEGPSRDGFFIYPV